MAVGLSMLVLSPLDFFCANIIVIIVRKIVHELAQQRVFTGNIPMGSTEIKANLFGLCGSARQFTLGGGTEFGTLVVEGTFKNIGK